MVGTNRATWCDWSALGGRAWSAQLFLPKLALEPPLKGSQNWRTLAPFWEPGWKLGLVNWRTPSEPRAMDFFFRSLQVHVRTTGIYNKAGYVRASLSRSVLHE